MTSAEHQRVIYQNIKGDNYVEDPFWEEWIAKHLYPPKSVRPREPLFFKLINSQGHTVSLSTVRYSTYEYAEIHERRECPTCPLFVPPEGLEEARPYLLTIRVKLPENLRGICLFGRASSNDYGPIIPKLLVPDPNRQTLQGCNKKAEARQVRGESLGARS